MVQILPKGILNAEIILVSVYLLKGLSLIAQHTARAVAVITCKPLGDLENNGFFFLASLSVIQLLHS